MLYLSSPLLKQVLFTLLNKHTQLKTEKTIVTDMHVKES